MVSTVTKGDTLKVQYSHNTQLKYLETDITA